MNRISIGATGDILPHGNVLKRAKDKSGYSFSGMLSGASDLFSAMDISIVNQEAIVAGDQYGISSFPKFNCPADILADFEELGVNVVNIANNHLLDKGEEALRASISNIREHGFHCVGAYDESESEDGVVVVEKKSIKVAFVSYADGSKINLKDAGSLHVNYFKGESYAMRMNRRISPIKKSVEVAKKSADIVVLSLHFGEEYHRQPSSFQREMVSSLVECGVDVIIGHHPHVLQPVEWVQNSKGKNVLVAFSLGNFFTGQLGLYRQIGAFLSFDVEQSGSGVAVVSPKVFYTFVDVYDGCKVRLLRDYYQEARPLKTSRQDSFCSKSVFDELLKMKCAGNAFLGNEKIISYE